MNKAAALLFVLISSSALFVASPLVAKTEPGRIVVPENYSTIKDAVSNANDGDVIFVRRGTYIENQIVITKKVSLLGENPENTTIKLSYTVGVQKFFGYELPTFTPYGIVIASDNVTISGFKIIPIGNVVFDQNCIKATGNFTQIKNNIINDIHGILLNGSNQIFAENNMTGTPIDFYGSMNNIYANNIADSEIGGTGSQNTILNNTISNGSMVVSGSLNSICNNNITGGLTLWKSDKTTIAKNDITLGWISLYDCPNSSVENNDIIVGSISLQTCSDMVIGSNYITKGDISLKGSWSNIIENNNVIEGSILLEYDDDSVWASSGNVVRKNRIINGTGLNLLFRSDDNMVYANLIENCLSGLAWSVTGIENGTIYHNNFVNNTLQFSLTNSEWAPSWGFYTYNSGYFYVDNGSEGNYWSDYNGTDSNGDGIGDAPYVVQEGNEEQFVPFIMDRYPLVFPFDFENSAVVLPAPFPMLQVVVLVAIVVVAGLLVYFRRRRQQTIPSSPVPDNS